MDQVHLSCGDSARGQAGVTCGDALAPVAEGFDPQMRLERPQTIMDGAPCCQFRYTIEDPEPPSGHS
ncbi:MAG: L-2-amino-thiazoline-4-carboxylic acid hydrolase [Propionibacteriaceae bacterium]|jgi:hypothetical protein|nr:L-2-amino-thiazoline-4-carboxylic acid hydrolase [Propionibacteriaceae bacterium]